MSDVIIPLFDLFKNSRMLQITIFILIITIIVGLILIIAFPEIMPFNIFSNIKTLSGGNKNETIFVSVASYRDAQCPMTLKDIFQKKLPRIHGFSKNELINRGHRKGKK